MKLLLADDHALFRGSLRALLIGRGLTVVGEASTGREAVEMALSLLPDLVLMDLGMPDLDGLEATRQIVAAGRGVRVVVLTASSEDDDVFAALQAGASGYLLKNLDTDAFLGLLDLALEGQLALTPSLSQRILDTLDPGQRGGRQHPDALTDRELDVLQAMVEGATSNRELSQRLGVSENTVKFHVRNILHKLHLNNRTQAVSLALRKRMVD